jgi:acetylornithine deacetylase/succinyl-diaminopimelate desuccinylase-like protein
MERVLLFIICVLTVVGVRAQSAAPVWAAVEVEALRHFQALVRFDTSDPPGNEKPAADYLRQVLEQEGIAVQTFAIDSRRPNVVARLRGDGSRRPLLLMAHTDTVNVDVAKWMHPPFGAARAGGYVYGRGTVDDKDNVAASLMVMLLLKRLNVPLTRDVIFLAESGEEGSTRFGIEHMVADPQFAAVNAEYCIAEGGGVTREGGRVRYASVQTLEKVPRRIELTARGVAGHGSVPLKTNPVVRVSAAVARLGEWRPPIRLNETTRTYFSRLAAISTGAQAIAYRAVLDPKTAGEADEYFWENEPRHSSMLRTSLSPNIVTGGYRVNVIPSEAKATVDTRMLPDENPEALLATVRKIINDPAVEVSWGVRNERPPGGTRLDTEAFRAIEAAVTAIYNTVTIPAMATGATDMSYLRARGVQCYGIGPATDVEDGPKGFGAHSDQERLLESELHRFVRFNWEIVTRLAAVR